MLKTLQGTPEFDNELPIEIEQKFIPVFPDHLSEYRLKGVPVEQYYLSHPTEDFSLRLRKIMPNDGETVYSATLKDRGTVTADGLKRLEVNADVTDSIYNYYRHTNVPIISKLRTIFNKHVVVDYYEDGHVQLESENPVAWTHFTGRNGTHFADITGDRIADNEWRAHLEYRRAHGGAEAFRPKESLDINAITKVIVETHKRNGQVLVRLTGRSGSGKSTIAHQIQTTLSSAGINTSIISTDDYHRGSTWLRNHNNGVEWSEWDHPIVYDTQAMATDLQSLLENHPIAERRIDFADCEPEVVGVIEPTPVIIVEGIYAGASDFDRFSPVTFDVPTPLATCIGRRLLRDLSERPEFANPAKSLKYILEQAEPEYRRQNDMST